MFAQAKRDIYAQENTSRKHLGDEEKLQSRQIFELSEISWAIVSGK